MTWHNAANGVIYNIIADVLHSLSCFRSALTWPIPDLFNVPALGPGIGADGRVHDEVVDHFGPRRMMRQVVVEIRSDLPDLY